MTAPLAKRNADALAALRKWQDDGSLVSMTGNELDQQSENLLADLGNADLPAAHDALAIELAGARKAARELADMIEAVAHGGALPLATWDRLCETIDGWVAP